MAHFAHVVDGVVVSVHVVVNSVITDSDGVEQEALGQEFLAGLHGTALSEWVQCSYNGSIRGMYPGLGYGYNPLTDAFFIPRSFDVEV